MATRPTPSQSESAAPLKTRSKPKSQRLPILVLFLAGLYVFLTRHFFGRLLMGLLGVTGVILIEMLIWRDNAQLFFQVLGVEFLITLVIGWIVYLVSNFDKV